MQEEELGMSLGEMLKVLKRHLVLIIVVPLIVGIVAGIYVKNNTVDMYTAQVKLYTLFDYVDATGTVRYDLSSSSYFANDYRELIRTNDVLSEASRRLGWDGWKRGVSISVSEVNNTRLMDLVVTSTDPQTSMDAANTLAAVFIEYIRNLMQQDSIRIASEATLPAYPSNSGRDSTAIMLYMLTLFGIVGVLLAKELFNTKVRSDSDVDLKYHVNVLSSINGYKKDMDAFLKQGRARNGNLLQAVNEYTQEGIKKLALNIEFAAMGAPLETLTVTSTTAMEGKSSVTLMLACEMASQGKQVLIVDMDYRSPMIGRYIGRRNKKDIMDYMNGSAALQEVVSRTATPNLFFMDSNHRMAINPHLPAFDQFIEDCKQYFDLVIFDTPPLGLFIDAASLAAKSDGVVVIVADGRVERREFAKVLAQLEQVKARVLGIAFNFVQQKEKTYYNRYSRYGKHHGHERKALARSRVVEDDDE